MNAPTALERLRSWERTALATLPTPLHATRRLAAELSDTPVDLYVKMDAETGFALGGNKVRKLEFELAPTQLEGVTRLLTAGGPQSNHCRVTAAAAARLGLKCTLVLTGPEPSNPTGNALLHRLLGADIVTVVDRGERNDRMQSVALECSARGEQPLVVPIGASTGLGSLGYAVAAVELMRQLGDLPPREGRTWLFVPTSSCGTLAGLLLGVSLLGREDVQLVGVSADVSAAELIDRTLEIAHDGAALLGWHGPMVGNLTALDDQVGEGYGVPTPAAQAAIELFAHTEGLVLDPTYTAKAAAGLVASVREERFRSEDRVVFLHTGGHPALLA
jgi:1-aminocyclopropane-1-carboxylate deaminase/D-cysteine desulfhydrase-like pyridoxal-dependent ACC family enzyme